MTRAELIAIRKRAELGLANAGTEAWDMPRAWYCEVILALLDELDTRSESARSYLFAAYGKTTKSS